MDKSIKGKVGFFLMVLLLGSLRPAPIEGGSLKDKERGYSGVVATVDRDGIIALVEPRRGCAHETEAISLVGPKLGGLRVTCTPVW